MKVDGIESGIVLDHITAGKSNQIYRLLGLESLDCCVAMIQNVRSTKLGKKDIIKIASEFEINLDVLGYIDPNISVSFIKDGAVAKKFTLALPQQLTNVLYCKNPRCITSSEQEIPHVFKLTDPEKQVYRCIYCEAKHSNH
ncbi:MAG: aspartate carbamoyltransferase regulatory subunit [Oscillospiraceae bacterium]|jgi:aspartate carbamoyltransferase regulatory subunit|nr:aspartate carbamoyltransferase regulatory subunit [Oscillospiraceae bacterium]